MLEIFKFVLFTGAVSGILLLYKSIDAHYESRKRNEEAVEAFRKDFLSAYHQLKLVRREFRFLTDVKDGQFLILENKRFGETYSVFNNAYVDFELLRKSISDTAGPFASIARQISQDMKTVDRYVRKIMIELESLDWVNQNSFDLPKVERLHSFLYTDGNPVHVAASKSLDRFLQRSSNL